MTEPTAPTPVEQLGYADALAATCVRLVGAGR